MLVSNNDPDAAVDDRTGPYSASFHVKRFTDEFVALIRSGPPGLFSRGELARVALHVEDGLAGARALIDAGHLVADDPTMSIVDIGSGGGVPGLPLAFAAPEARVCLVESQHWKARFLHDTIRTLDLSPRVEVRAQRVEELGSPGSTERESWQLGTARALAAPAVVAEYLAPLVRIGGLVVCFTTRRHAELDDAAITSVTQPLGLAAPFVLEARSALRDDGVLLCWPKVSAVGERFPRRIGVAAKRPLA